MKKVQKLRAFSRGLKAGRAGDPYVCPYTTPALMDQWIHGYQIASRPPLWATNKSEQVSREQNVSNDARKP
jgi:ribosome modulation factor